MEEMKWYVVHTLSGKENKVKELLEKTIEVQGMQDYFGEINVPTRKITEIKNGRQRTRTQKMFSAYVIIEMAMTPETYNMVINIPSVTNFLGYGKTPQPLRKDEINRLQGRQEGAKAEEIIMTFYVGEKVKIIDGAFSDFEGVVEQINKEKGRLIVNVSIFGRPTPVELHYTQVESYS